MSTRALWCGNTESLGDQASDPFDGGRSGLREFDGDAGLGGGMRVPVLARWLLGLGIVATMAANVPTV
jgi:hypothetical protein